MTPRPKLTCYHDIVGIEPPKWYQHWRVRGCPGCHALLLAVPVQRGSKIKWIWKEVLVGES